MEIVPHMSPVHNDLASSSQARVDSELKALLQTKGTLFKFSPDSQPAGSQPAASLPQAPGPPAPLTPAPTGPSQPSPVNQAGNVLGGGIGGSVMAWVGSLLGPAGAVTSAISWMAALVGGGIGSAVGGGGDQGGNLMIWNPGLNGGQYVNVNIGPELSSGDNQGYSVGTSVSQNSNGQIVDTITVVPN